MLSWLSSKVLPPNTRACVAPPGLVPSGNGQPVIVASLMRSGTHLLMDLLFNNFPELRQAPLYVDLDQYLKAGLSHDALMNAGTVVMKTHYPSVRELKREELFIQQLAVNAKVICPVRGKGAVQRSLAQFGYDKSSEQLKRESAEFTDFWSPFDPLEVPFEQLIQPIRTIDTLEKIADYLELPMPDIPVLPTPKSDRLKIYWEKANTRLRGAKAKKVNTGIKLGR